MAYTDLLNRLASSTEDRVADVYALHKAGGITVTEAQAVIVAIIGKANLKAASLAALSLSATITLQTGKPAPVTAPPPTTAPASGQRKLRSLNSAVATIFDTPEREADAVMRIKRLARLEPIDAASRAYSEEIARSGTVTGWTRGLSGKACQLCRWWWREGQVWPSTHRMPHHKGCTCTQVIVTRKVDTNVND